MQKKQFLIVFSGPQSAQLLRTYQTCKRSHDGRYIAFDGTAIFPDVMQQAERLSKHCERVQVFCGKVLGRLCGDYVNGQLQ